MMASAAWANPHALHPWFKMPSLKRKEVSSDEEDAPTTTTPIRGPAHASYDLRRSLSPTPSPKRRRCDVLESGMSQLTLDGRPIPPSPAHFAPGQFPPQPSTSTVGAPTVHFPDTPTTTTQPTAPLWADGPQVSPPMPAVDTGAMTPVVLPGSVEEPTSPEAAASTTDTEVDVPEVSMKVPSWYEIEKDRIVITDLEDSEAEEEEENDASRRGSSSTAGAGAADAPEFTISSALLDRLPKPTALAALAPEANPTNALVLYRPLPLPGSSSSDAAADARDSREEDTPRIEEVAGEDVLIVEDTEMPVDDEQQIGYSPIAVSPVPAAVDEPADEPMDVEML
ncbi:hypothetical protein C8Q77DRAFT_785042 [Trametes polyzona]|nr:hypothetical protein C8Q77DRAFT_785042 [Trametes polyzona]